jgi:hypothetical protein
MHSIASQAAVSHERADRYNKTPDHPSKLAWPIDLALSFHRIGTHRGEVNERGIANCDDSGVLASRLGRHIKNNMAD